MSYVYLGLFSKIAKWVFNNILSPITNWLGDILNKLFTWVANEIIIPAIQKIIVPILQKVWGVVYESLAGVIYKAFANLLKLLNNLNAVFDAIIGLSDVTYDGKSMTLLDVFFRNTSISKLYWYMTFIGFALCLLFSTVAVARSAFDLDFEGKKPVSRVLAMTLKAMLSMFAMQFFVYFVIRLAGAVLIGIRSATQYAFSGMAASPTLGGIIFCVASLNAAKNSRYNMPHASITEEPRLGYYNGSKSFMAYDTVGEDFAFAKFDYVVGILVALFLIVVMAACLLIFVRRLFDLVVLYVLSPFFVSTYPLDDGARFARWRDQFMGKAFSGFGMVVAMKLYLIIVPLVMDGKLVFSVSSGGKAASPEFDYVVKVLFLAGGAWAILKSGPMITSLISEAVGGQEERDAMTGAAAASFAGGTALSLAGSAVGSLFKGKQKEENGEDGKGQEGHAEHEGQFRGKGDQKSAAFKPGVKGQTGSALGGKENKEEKNKTELTSSGLFGMLKTYRFSGTDSNGRKYVKFRTGVDLGLVKFGATKDGIGFKTPFGKRLYDGEGKLKEHGFNLVLGGMAWKTGADGKSKFNSFHVLGFKGQADEKSGEFFFRGNSILGLKREKNENGEYAFSSVPFAFRDKYRIDENGDKRLESTSYMFGLRTKTYGVNSADNRSYVASDSWFGGLMKEEYGVNEKDGSTRITSRSSMWGANRIDYDYSQKVDKINKDIPYENNYISSIREFGRTTYEYVPPTPLSEQLKNAAPGSDTVKKDPVYIEMQTFSQGPEPPEKKDSSFHGGNDVKQGKVDK